MDDRENAGLSGYIQISMQTQEIRADQIEGDLFDLYQMSTFHRLAEDRTVYKNAGSAYLSIVISQDVVQRLSAL